MDYLSFYLTVGWHLRRLARADDVVVAMTDPPLLSVLVYWALTGRPVRVVNWLQDLYPEVATALGVGALGGRLGAWLRQVRNRSLRHATLNVAIGERMAKAVRATGIPSGQVRVLHNWADCEAIRPLAPAANRLRREWGVEDAFVVGYSGNLGRAHAYETVLDAAALLRAESAAGDTPVVFLFIGDGQRLAELRAEAARRGLESLLRFHPYQPRESLALSLGVADVHWISLRPALEGLIVPSKFYGVAAAGRPVLFVGDPDGEIPLLLAAHDCGLCVREGNGAGLAAAIRRLRDDVALRERQGAHARRLLVERFEQRRALEAWEGVLRSIEF